MYKMHVFYSRSLKFILAFIVILLHKTNSSLFSHVNLYITVSTINGALNVRTAHTLTAHYGFLTQTTQKEELF